MIRGVRRSVVDARDLGVEGALQIPVPETGAIATTSTTIPIPPRYCIMLRHQKIASGWSKSSSRVAPVVVKPLIASKKASIGLAEGAGEQERDRAGDRGRKPGRGSRRGSRGRGAGRRRGARGPRRRRPRAGRAPSTSDPDPDEDRDVLAVAERARGPRRRASRRRRPRGCRRPRVRSGPARLRVAVPRVALKSGR